MLFPMNRQYRDTAKRHCIHQIPSVDLISAVITPDDICVSADMEVAPILDATDLVFFHNSGSRMELRNS